MFLEIRKFYTDGDELLNFHFQEIFDTEEEPAICITDSGPNKNERVLVIAVGDDEIDITRGSTIYDFDDPRYGVLAGFVDSEILATLKENDKPFILYEGESEQDSSGYITIRNLGSVVPNPIYN